MLAHLLIAGLSLGAPDYTKKVMVDPDYKPSRTPQQIARTLAKPRRVRVVYRPAPARTVVYRTEVRRRRASWVWPVLTFGLYYGTHYAWHHHGHHRYYRGHYRWR
jgi:hypothetical protein